MLHPCPKPLRLSVIELEGERVPLGGDEEGVGARAESLNFFKIIPPSLKRKSFGGKIPFFLFLPPPPHTPVMLGRLGERPREPPGGGSCIVFSGLEVTPHSEQMGSLWEKESGKKAETSSNSPAPGCCETSRCLHASRGARRRAQPCEGWCLCPVLGPEAWHETWGGGELHSGSFPVGETHRVWCQHLCVRPGWGPLHEHKEGASASLR